MPIPSVPNYCATKAALHSLAWTLRAQLAADPASKHIRLREILPPAVRTELHAGRTDVDPNIGIPLAACIEEAWTGLQGDQDEIAISVIRDRFGNFEDGKRSVFDNIARAWKDARL